MMSIDTSGFSCQNVGMTMTAAPNDRQDAILDAAFGVFAAYGYRRASMEDIARAAGMSRTALYLHFRSKDDIFRSLTARYFDACVAAMEAALNAPGQSAETALFNGFVAKDGKFMEAVLSTPHGSELLDAGFAVSLDLALAGEAKMSGLIAGWLEEQGVPADLAPAKAVADTIFAALKGLKYTATSLDDLRTGEARLARLVARAMVRPEVTGP